MKKIYINKPRDQFWADYWQNIVEDANQIQDTSKYPLHLIDPYVKKESHIVELGCGLGRVLKHYHHQGILIEGLEYDAYCVDKIKQENDAYKVIQGNIVNLPYDDKFFDIAMAFGVLGHLEQGMKEAFAEINRVLKQQGLLAGSLCYSNLGRFIFGLIEKIKIWHRGGNKYFYTHLFSKREIRALLKEYGFELLEIQPVLSPEVLFRYFFFLRKKQKKKISEKELRSQAESYPLNCFGKLVYFCIKKIMPSQYTFTMSFVARKVSDVS